MHRRERSTVRRAVVTTFAAAAAFALALLPGAASAWTAPNDDLFSQQYGPVQIGAPDAWSKTTGKGVIVAVVDSGVDVDHADLKSKLVKGRDFGDGDDNADDDSQYVATENGRPKPMRGHGTHVAGTIAAVTNNREGVAGVAPDAQIMPLKIAETNDIGNWTQTVPQAIRYAVDNGAKVINLSITSYISPLGLVKLDSLEGPCNDAFQRGALCVIASGNAGESRGSGYTRDVNALIVTANDSQGKHAPFGQKADTKWALSAPGVAILSTYPVEDGSYKETQGTSMAAPHAAGVAALLFAQGMSAGEVVQRMLDTAIDMGNPSINGAGIVDAAAATGVARTDAPAEQPQSTPQGSVLLPKAATRTTLPPKAPSGATATTATPKPGDPAPPPATEDPNAGLESEDSFASDLTEGGGDELAGEPASSEGGSDDLAFYAVATIAGVLVLGTGLSAVSRLRKRTA